MLGDQGGQAACGEEGEKILRGPQIPPDLPSTLLRCFGLSLNQPHGAFLRLLLLTKVGFAGTALDLHPFGPSLNEEMAD